MVFIKTLETGFGLELTNDENGHSIWRWYGHIFGPSYSDQNFIIGTGWYDTVGAYLSTSSFDHSNLWPGHESAFGVAVIQFPGDESGTYTFKAIHKDGSTIHTITTNYSGNGDPGINFQYFSWIGLGLRKPDLLKSYREIDEDGTYSYTVSGDVTGSVNYTVSNIDLSRYTLYNTSDIGKIKINGDNLNYICEYGYNHIVNHDGSTYGNVGTQYAGQIWVPDGASGLAYLNYVDSSGNIRRTKNGDKYDNGEGYGTALGAKVGITTLSNSGYIWIQYDRIEFVAADGTCYRIGNGYYSLGNYQ